VCRDVSLRAKTEKYLKKGLTATNLSCIVRSDQSVTSVNHLSSLQLGDTLYVKGFEDQEFEFLGQSAEQPFVTVKLSDDRKVKTKAFPSLLCRLKAAPKSLTGAELWIVPAIQVAKRPFSRLVNFSVIALAVLAGAANAQTVDSGFMKFCEAASKANVSGISAAPGSELAKRVVENTNVKEQDYVSVWNIAKSSIVPICRGLW
jgi:hypothetical protein